MKTDVVKNVVTIKEIRCETEGGLRSRSEAIGLSLGGRR